MTFPKNLAELEEIIVKVWRATIDSLRKSIKRTDDRVTTTEKEIVTLDKEVTENTGEILATKKEVEDVRRLIGLLVFELIEQGIKIESPELLEELNLIQ